MDANLASILIQIAVLVFSVVVHEVAHGAMAYRFGDRTAYYQGRLTLNPLPHIDPFMTILMPAMLAFSGLPVFGGAKPVQWDPSQIRGISIRKASRLIAAAGPASNFVLLVIGILVFNLLFWLKIDSRGLETFLIQIIYINAILMAFNLLPIPPLDGSHVLASFLNFQAAASFNRIAPFGFLIIYALIFSGALGPYFYAIFSLIASFLPS